MIIDFFYGVILGIISGFIFEVMVKMYRINKEQKALEKEQMRLYKDLRQLLLKQKANKVKK